MATSSKSPPIYTGSAESVFDQVVLTLSMILQCDGELKAIYQKMDNKYEKEQATVTSRESGEEVLRPDRRRGSRHTFGADGVSLLEPMFLRMLCRDHKFAGLTIEKSHGDVLFYKKGDFFKWHRDTVPEEAPVPGAKYYTLLVGLLTTSAGGRTEICHDDEMVHSYRQSCTMGEYLFFPSEQRHCGQPIIEGYKMTLKMDFWVVDPPEESAGHCSCCRPTENLPELYHSESEPESEPESESPELAEYSYSDEDDSWCNGWHLD